MNTAVTKEKIGFIGTGVMGQSMAGHLIDAGYEVLVYTRTKTRAQALLEKGPTGKKPFKKWQNNLMLLSPW